MAFSNEGFSIREYTWRMRSVDVVKCWPFDDITIYDDRKIKAFLPQITVKRFRWWYYELQFAISRSNKKAKRKKGFKRNGSVVQEEAEESDDDRAPPFKPPKRRSVVELFALAPPMENVPEFDAASFVQPCHSDDVGVPNLESLNCDKKEKKIRNGHPKSPVLLKKKLNNDKNHLIVKDDELMESKIDKKRSCKARLHSPVHPTVSSSCSLIDKQHDEDSIVVDMCRKNKPQLKVLAKGKKNKFLRTSKLFSDCQKPDTPSQDIVGKPEKILMDQNSIKNKFHKARDENQYGTHQSKKDDKLGNLREESCPEKCSELSEGHMVNSSAVSLPEDCVQGTEVNFSFDSMNIIRETSNVQGNSFNGGKDALLTKEHHVYDCVPRPAVSLGDFARQGNAQISVNASATHATPNNFLQFDALSDNTIPRLNGLYSKEYANAALQASWSPMHPDFVLESTPRNFRTNSTPCYTIPHLTPNDMMHTICSPLNWKQKELIHGETRLHEDFIGLPLNSQGELIKMNSICKTVVDQSKTSSTVAGRLTSLGPTDVFPCRGKFSDVISGIGKRPLKGKLKNSPNKDSGLQKSYIAIPSGLVNLENQLTRKISMGLDPFDSDSHSNYPFAPDLEQISIPNISPKLDYQTLKHVNNLHIQKNSRSCQVQSTMRLMGKEFTVGESTLQQLEGGKVWTDKQIIVENISGSNGIEKSLGLLGSTEYTTKRLLNGIGASSTHLVDKESGLEQSLSSPNSQADVVAKYGFGSVGRKSSTQYLPSFRQTPSHPFLKNGFAIQESSKCAYSSSHSLPATNNVLVRSTSSNDSQLRVEVPHATLALGFPVLHSSPTWSHVNAQRVCSSWPGDSHKRALVDCLPSFCVSLENNYSESGSMMNLLNYPSLDKPTSNCLSPLYNLQKPLRLHASSYYHQISTVPGSTFDLVTHNRYGNKMNLKRQWNTRTSARGPDHCKRATKRPPKLLEDSTSQFPKLSLLDSQGDTMKPGQKDCPSSEVDTHCGNREAGSCFFSDVEKTNAGDQIGSYVSVDCSSELSSDETHDTARIGPVKLAGGGKHILKSSKKAGQTNILGPTSSTIHYVEAVRARSVLQSDEKPMRIYKF